jgi:hypothetical protein
VRTLRNQDGQLSLNDCSSIVQADGTRLIPGAAATASAGIRRPPTSAPCEARSQCRPDRHRRRHYRVPQQRGDMLSGLADPAAGAARPSCSPGWQMTRLGFIGCCDGQRRGDCSVRCRTQRSRGAIQPATRFQCGGGRFRSGAHAMSLRCRQSLNRIGQTDPRGLQKSRPCRTETVSSCSSR